MMIPSPLGQCLATDVRGLPGWINQNIMDHGFEDLQLGQDLDEEGTAQPDGGPPIDVDDQLVDKQAAVEFYSKLFKELPTPLKPTLESPSP
jgi:hypothetical protein